MFRLAIRDLLWLTVVASICQDAAAQTRTFKNGDRVYVRYMNREGYGVVKGSDSLFYIVELEQSFGRTVTQQFPRNSVFESLEHANKRQLPQDRPQLPDLAALYQAIGAAMGSCFVVALFVAGVIHIVRRRFKTPSATAIDAEVLP